MVPVVYGAEGVHKVAPPDSYIDVRDFKSPKHLAEYLLYLHKNDKEYMKYFRMKKHFKVHRKSISVFTVFCNLCRYLAKHSGSNIIDNFPEWFFENKTGLNAVIKYK